MADYQKNKFMVSFPKIWKVIDNTRLNSEGISRILMDSSNQIQIQHLFELNVMMTLNLLEM